MRYDKNKFVKTFEDWDNLIKEYHLPYWDQLISIDLYMDQVIVLMNKYLYIFNKTSNEETIITSSMVNNYVKLKIIPAPEKKKYSRRHIAYLIIVCILKQTLSISTIKKIIPLDIPESEAKIIYDSFVHNQRKSLCYVTEKIREVADPIIRSPEDNQERLNDLAMQVATSTNIFKIFIEKIVDLKLDD